MITLVGRQADVKDTERRMRLGMSSGRGANRLNYPLGNQHVVYLSFLPAVRIELTYVPTTQPKPPQCDEGK